MAHPHYTHCKRKSVLIGWGLVGIGLLLFLLPIGPGIIIILIGLSVLSFHSAWAKRKAVYLTNIHPAVADKVDWASRRVRSLFALVTHETDEHEVVLDGTRYSLLVDASRIAGGTAVLLHGATGVKENPLMEALVGAARQAGHNVVRFDAFNSFGKSGGSVREMTLTSYREDLERILAWARQQDWWSEPLTLIGHSVGGLVALLHVVESRTPQAAQLVLVAPMISGERYETVGQSHEPDVFEKWRASGEREVAHPQTGEKGVLSWGFVEDAKRYDALKGAKLPCPTLLVVGSEDDVSPPSDVSQLLTHAEADITLKVIEGAPHTPTNESQLRDVEKTVDSWLDEVT